MMRLWCVQASVGGGVTAGVEPSALSRMRSRSKAAAAPHARSTLRGTHAHASFREGMRAGPALARSTYEGSIAPNGTAVEAARAEPEANAATAFYKYPFCL